MGKIKLDEINGIPTYNFDIPIDEFDKAIKYSWIKFSRKSSSLLGRDLEVH